MDVAHTPTDAHTQTQTDTHSCKNTGTGCLSLFGEVIEVG